jgi:hypothetical protein
MELNSAGTRWTTFHFVSWSNGINHFLVQAVWRITIKFPVFVATLVFINFFPVARGLPLLW